MLSATDIRSRKNQGGHALTNKLLNKFFRIRLIGH